ncbi:hypothetical protein VTN02DRAFT_4321 [Thermoascus thermophilus]
MYLSWPYRDQPMERQGHRTNMRIFGCKILCPLKIKRDCETVPPTLLQYRVCVCRENFARIDHLRTACP